MDHKLTVCAFLLVFFPIAAEAGERTIVSFDSPDSGKPWQTVNDGVMGGRSSGRFRISQSGEMEFYGSLSLLNNGGFASVRARAKNLALTANDKIVARVRGDGREYKFNLYTQSNMGGYSYRQSFQTKRNEWIEVEFPMSGFVATWRGRTYPNERLEASRVSGLGFLLGDKRQGPFKLEIDWIKIRD